MFLSTNCTTWKIGNRPVCKRTRCDICTARLTMPMAIVTEMPWPCAPSRGSSAAPSVSASSGIDALAQGSGAWFACTVGPCVSTGLSVEEPAKGSDCSPGLKSSICMLGYVSGSCTRQKCFPVRTCLLSAKFQHSRHHGHPFLCS